MVSKTFGETLFRCTDEHTELFPSPEALKNKILISTKPPKEYLQTQVSQGSTTDESVKAKVRKRKKTTELKLTFSVFQWFF